MNLRVLAGARMGAAWSREIDHMQIHKHHLMSTCSRLLSYLNVFLVNGVLPIAIMLAWHHIFLCCPTQRCSILLMLIVVLRPLMFMLDPWVRTHGTFSVFVWVTALQSWATARTMTVPPPWRRNEVYDPKTDEWKWEPEPPPAIDEREILLYWGLLPALLLLLLVPYWRVEYPTRMLVGRVIMGLALIAFNAYAWLLLLPNPNNVLLFASAVACALRAPTRLTKLPPVLDALVVLALPPLIPLWTDVWFFSYPRCSGSNTFHFIPPLLAATFQTELMECLSILECAARTEEGTNLADAVLTLVATQTAIFGTLFMAFMCFREPKFFYYFLLPFIIWAVALLLWDALELSSCIRACARRVLLWLIIGEGAVRVEVHYQSASDGTPRVLPLLKQ